MRGKIEVGSSKKMSNYSAFAQKTPLNEGDFEEFSSSICQLIAKEY